MSTCLLRDGEQTSNATTFMLPTSHYDHDIGTLYFVYVPSSSNLRNLDDCEQLYFLSMFFAANVAHTVVNPDIVSSSTNWRNPLEG